MILTVAADFGERASDNYRAVATSVWEVVDKLIPGTPPFGGRDIRILKGSCRVLWDANDYHSSTYRITIDANPTFWMQLAYQLSHELGHVKMGAARSNLLLETFATAVSLEVLHRLREEWSRSPPFPGDWTSYAKGFPAFRADSIRKTLEKSPEHLHPKADLASCEAKKRWLSEVRAEITTLPITERASRAWQHVAADLLIEEALADRASWAELLGIAQNTVPPPTSDIRYRDDLSLSPPSIPAWIPDWLR